MFLLSLWLPVYLQYPWEINTLSLLSLSYWGNPLPHILHFRTAAFYFSIITTKEEGVFILFWILHPVSFSEQEKWPRVFEGEGGHYCPCCVSSRRKEEIFHPDLKKGGDFFVSFYIYPGKADNRPTLMNNTINHCSDNERKSEVYVRLTTYCFFQLGHGCL